MGLLITFEGGEGCGKSTQSKRLAQKLTEAGHEVVRTYEPGGTDLGMEIRRSLKKPRETTVAPETELLLFAAARAQLTQEVILPALSEDCIVICDRFTDSTLAYQGYGRGISLDLVETLNTIAARGIIPDLVLLLDMDPALALKRKMQSRDRFEYEDISFHERVRKGYLFLAEQDPERWLVLNAAQPLNYTSQAILERVQGLIAQHRIRLRRS
ncbi:MAG: dTMP kinase [Dehalococcoidia bacterium]|nr:dTMP kinase [Dehalococcoidia bacterium]